MTLRNNERGATLLEYGALLGFLATLTISAVSFLGETNEKTLDTAATEIGKGVNAGKNDGDSTGGGSGNTPSPTAPDEDFGDALVLTYNASNGEVTLPLGETVNVAIDWGGTNASCPATAKSSGFYTCTYDAPGTYQVKIDGTMTQLGHYETNPVPNIGNLVSVDSWGSTGLESIHQAFLGAVNLTAVPGDIPSTVITARSAFKNSTFNGGGVKTWDVSRITNFISMFENNPNFNQDISAWAPTAAWEMDRMFKNATQFNKPIGNWRPDWLNSSEGMFENAINFDQDLTGWNMAGVGKAANMFKGAVNFNGDISNWSVSNAHNMSGMFEGASAFDGDISGWSTFSLQYADMMFKDATAFNANIAGWDTSQIESMEAMFQGATSFDQNIGAFATSKVMNMTSMFQGATAFNRDLSGWCVSNINAKPSGFDDGATAWSNMRPVWGSCP